MIGVDYVSIYMAHKSAGEHWVIIARSGKDDERIGPFSSSDAARKEYDNQVIHEQKNSLGRGLKAPTDCK